MIADTNRCCAVVWDRNSRWPRSHACKSAAKVERDGKSYCNVHDPVRLAAKQAERDKTSRIRSDAMVANWRREATAATLLDAVLEATTDAQTLKACAKARAAMKKGSK